MTQVDVLIVGGGIAGASLGAEIAASRSVLLIEAEPVCGFHSTGRSAAFWLESYGGPVVAQLSAGSRDFLDRPPRDFSETGFLRTRGDLHLVRDELPEIPASVETRIVERAELEKLVPGLRPEWRRALLEPGCADIDVAALHAAYLRRFRQAGGEVRTDSALVSAVRRGGCWQATLRDGRATEAKTIVDAAGAWADLDPALPFPIPVEPVSGQIVELTDDGPFPTVLGSDEVYLVPRGRRILVGATVERTGFRKEVTAAGVAELLSAAIGLAPSLARARVTGSWSGLRPGTPDDLPILGESPIRGLFLAAGHFRNGILLAPLTALLLADAVTGVLSRDLSLFSPERFAGATRVG